MALKVAFVLGQNGQGGTESQAKLLIKELILRGVAVDVILVDGKSGISGLPAHTRVLDQGRRSGLRGLGGGVSTLYKLRRCIRSGDYDVVHSAMARAYVLASLASVGLRGVRRVSWRRNLGIHLGNSRMKLLLELFALRHTDVIVSNSGDVRDYWLQLGGPGRAEHVVIPNLLEGWRYEKVQGVARVEGRTRVVTVGGLKPVKAHHDLINALGSRSSLRSQVELVLIGEGPERESLVELADRQGVHVIFTGGLSDTRPWMVGSDIYAHSSHSEGSSNAVAEAMAAGLPVIATDVGGMRELVDDAGVLIPAGDEQAMADALWDLIMSPEKRHSLGVAAQQKARRRMAASEVVDQYLGVYGDSVCAA